MPAAQKNKCIYKVRVLNEEGYCFAFYPYVKGSYAVQRIRKEFYNCIVKQKKISQ